IISWLLWPPILATNPIPQASCSCAGSYRPWAGGRPFFGFRRVVMDFVRWTEFLSNHSFLGVAWAGDRTSHPLLRNRLSYSRAWRQAKYNAEFRCNPCKFRGASLVDGFRVIHCELR